MSFIEVGDQKTIETFSEYANKNRNLDEANALTRKLKTKKHNAYQTLDLILRNRQLIIQKLNKIKNSDFGFLFDILIYGLLAVLKIQSKKR